MVGCTHCHYQPAFPASALQCPALPPLHPARCHASRLDSFSGFVKVHNMMATRFDPHYGRQLNDEVLQGAAHNLGVWQSSISERVRCAQLADHYDPFGHCLVCALTNRRALNDGEWSCFRNMGPPLPHQVCICCSAYLSCCNWPMHMR